MTQKEAAFSNLLEFKQILDGLGVRFFLDGGTLLGSVRAKDFCRDDEDDIDLASFAEYQKFIPEIIKRANEQGFYLHWWWNGDERAKGKGQEIAVHRYFKGKKLKIDLYFYEKKDDTAWTGVYRESTLTPRVVPWKHIGKLDTIDFKGTKFSIPNNVEDYLEWTYGDWKTPIHRSNYSCYNPSQLKALKPDFRFW